MCSLNLAMEIKLQRLEGSVSNVFPENSDQNKTSLRDLPTLSTEWCTPMNHTLGDISFLNQMFMTILVRHVLNKHEKTMTARSLNSKIWICCCGMNQQRLLPSSTAVKWKSLSCCHANTSFALFASDLGSLLKCKEENSQKMIWRACLISVPLHFLKISFDYA